MHGIIDQRLPKFESAISSRSHAPSLVRARASLSCRGSYSFSASSPSPNIALPQGDVRGRRLVHRDNLGIKGQTGTS